MSARQQRNVQYLLVGGTANLSTGAFSSMNAGEIGVFDAAGNRVVESGAGAGEVNATEGMEFFLALGGSSPMKRTPLINGSKIKKIGATAYTAATEQLDYIGYNGTSGSIDAINSNLYMLDIYIEDYLVSSHDGRYIKHAQMKSDASATQAEIAIAVAASGIYNFQREVKNTSGDRPIKFKALSSATGATEANNITVVKGGKVVAAAGALTAVVGDFLRFGSPGGGATTTDDVYKVISISGTDYTLDRPLQVASGTYATGTADADVITAAQADAADWGIALEAQPQNHVNGKEFFKKIAFSVILGGDGWGATTHTASVAASKGVGEVDSVKDLEWFCAGNNGEYFRMGEPTIHPLVSDVDSSVSGGGYDFLDIQFEDDTVGSFVANVSPISVTIASPATAPDYMTNGTDGVRDVLEAIASSLSAGDLDV